MKQKTYRFFELDNLETILEEIANLEDYRVSSGILMQLYNPRLNVDEDKMVQMINNICPKAVLSGMTCASLAEELYDLRNEPLQLSVSYFFDTQLVRLEFDLNEISMFVSGRIMNEKLDELTNVKCIQTFYVSAYSSIHAFSTEFNHRNIPMFGAKAGRNIYAKNAAHIYGSKCFNNGIICIAFLSTALSIFMDNNLGWQEIGSEMVMTKVDGDRIVSEVDNISAVEVYEKYLKVKPNEYFVQNVCEFPFILHRKDEFVARVPQAFNEDGGIIFNSDVYQGEHFRLSYALPQNILTETKRELESISWLRPEAIYFFECGNRQRFLRKYYRQELVMFANFFPENSNTTGYAELFSTPNEPICDLNSALVIVGLAENPESKDLFIGSKKDYVIEQEENPKREIPFIDRILTFLESTSKELDAVNTQLGKLAFTDQLTKVYNRWELERNINNAIGLAQNGSSFALLFFDIDHFKHVNDTFGHDVGDLVLREIVNIVKKELKPDHVFGRWGGEEFLYLIPDMDEAKAMEYADYIRKNIENTCLVMVRQVTVSIGVTIIKKDDTLETFVKRADDALYEAKETGRNKVVFKL